MFSRGIEPPPPCPWPSPWLCPLLRPPASAGATPNVSAADPAAAPARNLRRSNPSSRMDYLQSGRGPTTRSTSRWIIQTFRFPVVDADHGHRGGVGSLDRLP